MGEGMDMEEREKETEKLTATVDPFLPTPLVRMRESAMKRL